MKLTEADEDCIKKGYIIEAFENIPLQWYHGANSMKSCLIVWFKMSCFKSKSTPCRYEPMASM